LFGYLLTDELKKRGIIIDSNEYAWKYEDAIVVIGVLKENGYIILGGDVLNESFEYTYDNWFFENKQKLTNINAVRKSAKKSVQYINWYHEKFGDNFYYVIVADRAI